MNGLLTRRSLLAATLGASAPFGHVASAQNPPQTDFVAFLDGLRAEAGGQGIAKPTLDAAFADLRSPDTEILGRIAKQGEFSRPIWEYLVGAVTPGRLARGRALAERLSSVLGEIETRTGVPRWVILAFWGIESDFGASPGTVPVMRALTTLAFAGHKAANFRGEVLAALRILQRGDIPVERLLGSWAGAMGQVQFLPGVYLQYAVDHDGDGRADIWNSQPDALASIGNYLARIGWSPNYSWGYEIVLPRDFDLARYRGDFSAFAQRGVRRTDGHSLPESGDASLFLPGGFGGPAFLITGNFDVIRIYNTSDSYALAVGHLADRLGGAPALAAPWPSTAPRLDRADLLTLQAALGDRGLYAGERDGRAGPKLREAVRRYQIDAGLPADGYASPALLDHVKRRP